ncbi:hypothetical protein A1O3_05274 [Capronia epimyces CBS 606.96]|uniref:Uncharacterized protein n=1 Tax=Capronia epimyces CBS 606.96 TaxID=1182542 RepID=W9YQQ4_9EURO|nr:uncharacterized protein A1O3_05274 [Capronia epimyces CBS 606.96]EXJ84604.1 hypothetical protein A1O3_05274 [Capronia epimyces CBS 606.96]
MFFTSPASNITPALTSVAMSRSDSRDSTASSTSYRYTSCAPSIAYAALMGASPTSSSSWPTSHALTRSESNASSTTSHSQASSLAMRRDSSTSTWLPSPYRSCMSSFGSEPNSYLSDDDLLCLPEDLSLPVETIPALAPKKELTTEEQIAFLRELQEREDALRRAAGHGQQARDADARRKVVRFAGHHDVASSGKSRRPSSLKRRQSGLRRLNGPQ